MNRGLIRRVMSCCCWILKFLIVKSLPPSRLAPRQSSKKTYSFPRNSITPQLSTDNFFGQTPHSGRHFLPSHPAFRKPRLRRLLWKRRRRFMEGWYYRLTLVEHNISFAFIVSIEDPGIPSDFNLACIQVIGPKDGYLVQADKDDTKFWAARQEQALGCTFEYFSNIESVPETVTAIPPEEWKCKVKSGFQVSPTHLIGRINGHDGSGGVLKGMGKKGYCEFDFSVRPICGWGGDLSSKQKSTAGWLASFEIFEPHWQVTMADARASGFVMWNNTKYDFNDEPFYAEKNWGAALPSKWYWTQCNYFQGFDQLSVTAGGGVRKLPFGQKEALGMIGLHYNGTFYEAVPWNGSMRWNVSTWGRWSLEGECTSGSKLFAVKVEYECDPELLPGLVFRAPTPDKGMVLFCKDTFEAATTVSLWELQPDKMTGLLLKKEPPIIDRAKSNHGGAEIGGGPWWEDWVATSKVKPFISFLLRLPQRLSIIHKELDKKNT